MKDLPKRQTSLAKWLLRPQTVIGLSAVLLSLCGLFIAIYEASLIRRAQRASVWPYVEIGSSIKGDSLTLWVRNTGIGPARIDAAGIVYEGETKADWVDLIRSVSDVERFDAYYSMIGGRVLPPDSERERIFALTEEHGAGAQKLRRELGREIFAGRIDVRVCYCSVFDECWQSRLQDLVRRLGAADAPPPEGESPRPVASCAGAERSGI